jgi:hypothetical protein
MVAALFLEQKVVGGAGIKWRVDIDEVRATICHVLTKDFQVVARMVAK